MRLVIASQGDTVDLICWRELGRTAGVTETVLDANPGLAALGPVLPIGTVVMIPDELPSPQQSTVKLWE